RFLMRCVSLASGVLLASSLTVGAATTVSNPTSRLAKIAIPGHPLKAFDIGWVDPATARYYLADRSNAAVDIFDVTTNEAVGQIAGFKGFTGNNDTSGPDGVVVTFSGHELWAGDGDSTVKVIDLARGSIVASVSTGGKARADELAYDPQHQLILVANDADDPPYLSFISVGSRQVLKKVAFPDATDGLEQPVYDSATGMFYQAVPATTAHEGGEVAVLDPTSMSVTARYPLSDCSPHGLTTGPAGTNQLLAGCSKAHRSTIIDKTNGAVLADFDQTGGSDEVWFNAGDNRYYLAENAAQTLGVIDATSMAFVENVETGLGAHSVAADSVSNHVFVPVAAPDPACPRGCIAVFASTLGDRGDQPRQ
ncbi:MAG TPA: hypothetical protein VF937_16870, partial [Chloroflexota bacterium]